MGGEFKRARETKAFKCDRAAARTMLTNWYSYDLAEGETDKVVRILQNDNIALKPLAARIIKAQTAAKESKIARIAKGVSKGVSKGFEGVLERLADVEGDSKNKEIQALREENSHIDSELDKLRKDYESLRVRLTMTESENEAFAQNQSIPAHFLVDKKAKVHIYDNVTSYSIDVTDLR